MNEEEIIKGITNIIYTCNDVIEDEEWYNQEEIESAKEQLKFTEGLLDLYQKEKERNKELDRENQALFEAYNFDDTNLLAKILKEYRKSIKNSISKDKIKQKIEELDKEEKQKLKGTKGQDRYLIKQEYMYKRNILQELLEE